MEKNLTVRELINGATGFDPMSIDTGEIRALSNAMPADGNIDTNNAEVLATKYLRGADICAEMIAIATAYAQKTDTLKKKAYSIAALIKSQKAGIKTDKSRAWFAEMDDDYIDVCNKYSEAIAFVKWINGKHESFVKMHYLCKKILDRGYEQEKTANWNGSAPEDEGTNSW